jgi:hypothetical protein
MALTSGSALARAQAAEVTAKVVAERLVEYLAASGFVIMRKPADGGTSPQRYPEGWPHTKRLGSLGPREAPVASQFRRGASRLQGLWAFTISNSILDLPKLPGLL